MLAYVFWHWPGPGVDATRYTEALVAFHRALAASPSAGLRGTRAYAVEAAPWLAAARAYEDWYLVDDFAALGALNEAAVSGARREPHDTAARLAGGGHGGVYRLVALAPVPPRGGSAGETGAHLDRSTTWFSKPAGVPYKDFLARLSPCETWQRQMVLGPAPEFCIVGVDATAAVGGVAVGVRALYAGP